jgi:hypothetical protein
MKMLKLMIAAMAILPAAANAQWQYPVARATPFIVNGAANAVRSANNLGQQEAQRQIREAAIRTAQQAADRAARWVAVGDPIRNNGGNYANSTPQMRICSNGVQQWRC